MADMSKDQTPTMTDAELAPAGLPMLDMDQVATVTGVISVGAAWDASTKGRGGVFGKLSKKGGADLDAVAVLIQDGDPTVLCVGWDENYKNPLHGQPGDGSLIHTGDAITGEEAQDGDDEALIVDLSKIPAEFDGIVFQVAAFKKKNKAMKDVGFQGAANVLFTVYDGRPEQKDKQFCIRPSLVGTENCVIVCALTRVKDAQGRPTTTWELRKKRRRVNVEHGNVAALIGAATAAFMAQ
jgi:tellurium resistance protein TerZ